MILLTTIMVLSWMMVMEKLIQKITWSEVGENQRRRKIDKILGGSNR